MVNLDKIKFVTIKYVTEKEDLVMEALKRILPEELRQKVEKENVSRMSVIGQFGDPMLLIDVTTDKDVPFIAKEIFRRLTDTEKKRLIHEFDTRMDHDSTTFFFRLDKFAPLRDDLYLNDGSDVIKVELKFKIYGKYDPQEIRNYLLSLMELKEEAK